MAQSHLDFLLEKGSAPSAAEAAPKDKQATQREQVEREMVKQEARPAPVSGGIPGLGAKTWALEDLAKTPVGQAPRGIEVSPDEPGLTPYQEARQTVRHPSQRVDRRWLPHTEFVMPPSSVRKVFVRQGLVAEEDIDDREVFRDLWQRERAEAWAPELPKYDPHWVQTVVDPVIQRAEVSIPLVALPGVDAAIHYPRYREQLFYESLKRIETISQLRYVDADPDKKLEMAEKAQEVADAAFMRATQKYKGVPWADAYGEDATEWIMDLPSAIRPFAAVLNPMSSTMDPLTVGSLKQERSLSAFANMAPSTALTAMLKTGKSWGSRESIEAIRRGADPFQSLHLWGDLVLQNFYEDPRSAPETLRKGVGLSIVLPMILLEPDPFSVSLGLAAPAAKIAKVTSATQRLTKRADIAQEAVSDLRKGGTVESDIHYRLRNEAPATRLALEAAGASELAKPVDEVFKELEKLREGQVKLQEEAALLEQKALKFHGPEKKGGDPKGVDAATLAEMRATNARERARVDYEIAALEAEQAQAQARVAYEFYAPDLDDIGTSYRQGQIEANKKLRANKAELKALKADSERKAFIKEGQKLADLPVAQIRVLPEVRAWGLKVQRTGGKAGTPPTIAKAEASLGGDLKIYFRIPGKEGLSSHVLKASELKRDTRQMLKSYNNANRLHAKEYSRRWGKRIEDLEKEKKYLETLREEFKQGGPIRALMESAKAAEDAAKAASKKYSEAYKAWEKADEALRGKVKPHRFQKGAVPNLQESIEKVAKLRARVIDEAALRERALDKMQEVVDSMRAHRDFVQKTYGRGRAALASGEELRHIGKIYEKRAQKTAARAIRAGLRGVDDTTVAWDPVAAEVALRAHPGHQGVDYLDLPKKFKTAGNVSRDEVKIIQDEIDRAAMRIEDAYVTQGDRAWGAAIQAAWDDIAIMGAGDIRQKAASTWARIERRFSAIDSTLGTQGEQFAQGFRVADNTIGLGFIEIRQFLRGRTGSPKEITTGIVDFLTKGLKDWTYKGSTSTYRAALQDEEVWDVARRAMNDATFQDVREIADITARVDAQKLQAQANVDREYRALQDKAAKVGLEPEDYDFYALEQQRLAVEKEGLDIRLQPELNFMVETIARSYLGTGVGATGAPIGDLYKQTALAIANPDNSFEDVMKIVAAATLKHHHTAGSKQGAYTRAAAASVVATGFDRLAAHAKALSGGILEMEDAIALNRLLSGEMAETAAGKTLRRGERVSEDVRGAQAAIRVGMPFTERSLKKRGDAAEISKELVSLGNQAIVPRALVDELGNRYNHYMMDLSPYFRRPVQASDTEPWTAAHAFNTWQQVWKTSLVTGYLVPNPRYWVNNIFGDFSQMWSEVGLVRSGRLSFQNVLSNFGAGGRALQTGALQAAEALDKAGRKMGLPSVMEVFMNPYLGRLFKGEKGFFRTKYGRTIQFDEVRTMALEDGILETFVNEEILRQLGKKNLVGGKLGAMGNKLGWWQNDLTEAANLVQQRQRMALYCDLLQRGATRAEAKQRTLSALYDWKHGIAQQEVNWLTRMVPFYRFWRLAMKQVTNSLMEPFMRPTGDYLTRAMTGRTRLARARQQTAFVYGLPDIFFSENPDEYISQTEASNELFNRKFPGWMDTKSVLGQHATSLAMRQWLLENQGKTATHTAYTLPPFTMLDSFSLGNSMLTVISWAGAKGSRMLPWREDSFDYSTKPSEMDATAFEPFIGMTFPAMEFMLRTLGDRIGLNLEYTNRSDYRTLNSAEEAVFRTTDLGAAYIITDADTGRSKVPTGIYRIFRSIPGVGTQAPYWVGAKTDNPFWDPNSLLPRDTRAYSYAFRKISKLGTEYYTNPARSFQYEQKGVKEEFSRSPYKEGLKEDHPRKPKSERKALPPGTE
jgi:hypothetical protein